jgi:5S rRNA maturation endonuclease (ribonuclease M5)
MMKRKRSIADKRKDSEKLPAHRALCFRHAEIARTLNIYSLEADRGDRLKTILQAAYEANKQVPVVVEGRRDAEALRKLGFTGKIITFHSGKSIYDFCEALSAQYDRVILLMDWDEPGDQLFSSLSENLCGYWEEFSSFRDDIRSFCQKDIKDIQSIPGLLERLTGEQIVLGDELFENGH